MAIKHNNAIISNHFRKDWQRRVRCHFDQPGRKLRRRNARAAKVAKVAPRPVDKLRPIVRCPTVKYNRRVRAGRGFSLAELKEAGIPRRYAPTIGISVDGRRVNLSEETLAANVARLKSYMERVIVFPRKNGKVKKGDASKEDVAGVKASNIAKKINSAFRIVDEDRAAAFSEIKSSELPEGTEDAYRKLRVARSDKKYAGKRAKRAAAKAEEESAAKK